MKRPAIIIMLCIWLNCPAAASEGLAVEGGAGASTKTKARPPNFILIFTDDQGYQDIGCFGSPDIRTPNLDRLAAEGRKFTDFYVAAPICSASRAALMTGSYCERVSITGVFFPRHHKGLNPKEITIAEILKKKGYATACIGKWHLGHSPKFLPIRQGFDYYYGIPYSNDMSVDPKAPLAEDIVLRKGVTVARIRSEKPRKNWVPLMLNEQVIEYPADQRTLTRRYTEESLKFIRANKDKPFFLYLPHTMPHVPLYVSDDFQNRNKERGIYGDVIEEIDWSVGEILKMLKELNIDEHTLVVFTSDNGPWLSKGKHGGCALPLRDGKFTTYEGGMRVPCIMRMPGRVPAGSVCSEPAATIDILPTFAELAGAETPQDRVIDGRSIVPLLEGKKAAKSPHKAYFYRFSAVRVGRWKLHLMSRSTVKSQPAGPFPELYDLSKDISEKHNVAGKHPKIVERLSKLIRDHRKEIRQNRRPIGKLIDN